jgi:glycosyltransferase involved in cell wall biosynthesis
MTTELTAISSAVVVVFMAEFRPDVEERLDSEQAARSPAHLIYGRGVANLSSARRPTVSVVIPCYGYGRFLPDCVQSVLDQDGVDVRVLIIDDASPDDSADVAARLAAADDRVEARRHAQNHGHIATYNEGLLEWADGDYSILLSADDLLTPGAISRAADVMEAHAGVGFVYGHPLTWRDDEPRPTARTEINGVTVWSGLDWLRIVCGLATPVVSSPEVVVRTSLQQQIGGYLPTLPHTADAEMWMRFAVHADVAFVRGVDQAFYRKHGSNMTIERIPIVDLRQRKASYDAIFETYPDRIPNLAALQQRVFRKMAKEALREACRAYDRGAVDPKNVAELVEFARAVYGEADHLPEFLSLRWRRRVGPEMCRAIRPVLVPAAVSRRARATLWWRHWKREGV